MVARVRAELGFMVHDMIELSPGEKKMVEVDDIPVALFNVNGEFFAIEDVCTHDGGPLAEGELDGDQIECPRHGARFNVTLIIAHFLPLSQPN